MPGFYRPAGRRSRIRQLLYAEINPAEEKLIARSGVQLETIATPPHNEFATPRVQDLPDQCETRRSPRLLVGVFTDAMSEIARDFRQLATRRTSRRCWTYTAVQP